MNISMPFLIIHNSKFIRGGEGAYPRANDLHCIYYTPKLSRAVARTLIGEGLLYSYIHVLQAGRFIFKLISLNMI